MRRPLRPLLLPDAERRGGLSGKQIDIQPEAGQQSARLRLGGATVRDHPPPARRAKLSGRSTLSRIDR